MNKNPVFTDLEEVIETPKRLPDCLPYRVEVVMAWADRPWRYLPIAAIVLDLISIDMQTYQYDEIVNFKYHLAPYQGNELCEYFFENWS